MREEENAAEHAEEVGDPETLAPAPPRPEPIEEAEPLAQDRWAGIRGLMVLFLAAAAVLVAAWAMGILAVPGSGSGLAECRRVCDSLGVDVASYEDGSCVCTRP